MLTEAVTEIQIRGATYWRSTFHPKTKMIIVEGWYKKPEAEGDFPL